MKRSLPPLLREEWLQLLLLLLPLTAAFAAMPFANHRVPMQWNLAGGVNWYAPKQWGLLVLPVASVLILALVMWLESRDPRRRHEDGALTAHGRATRLMRLAITVMLGAVTIIQIAASLGRHPDVSRWVPTLTALLIAFLGNFFGKLKPNRYVGIRVPWTNNSEHVWRVTHRVSGYIYTASGLLMAVLAWLLPQPWHIAAEVGWIFLLVVAPLLIAWRVARAEQLSTQSQM